MGRNRCVNYQEDLAKGKCRLKAALCVQKRQPLTKTCGREFSATTIVCEPDDFIPRAMPDLNLPTRKWRISAKQRNLEEESGLTDSAHAPFEFINEKLFDEQKEVTENRREKCVEEQTSRSALENICGFIVAPKKDDFFLKCRHCTADFPIQHWSDFHTHVVEKHTASYVSWSKKMIPCTKNGPDSQYNVVYAADDIETAQNDSADIAPGTTDIEFKDTNKGMASAGLKSCIGIRSEKNKKENEVQKNPKNFKKCAKFLSNRPSDAGTKPLASSAKYNCNICEDATFVNIKEMRAHKRNYHSAQKKRKPEGSHNTSSHLVCELCGKTFRLRSSYYAHKIIHKPRTFTCELCPSAYHQRKQFNEHMKSHRNERDHVCEQCGRAFVRKRNLKEHQLTKHSNEKPYACGICGQKFRHYIYLNNHRQRDHLVLEGSIEQLMNPPKRNMKHKFIVDAVTKLKRIVCQFCGNTYRYHGGLRVHMINEHGYQAYRRSQTTGNTKAFDENKTTTNGEQTAAIREEESTLQIEQAAASPPVGDDEQLMDEGDYEIQSIVIEPVLFDEALLMESL